MTEPYYSDELVTLFHGDFRDVDAWHQADAVVTDPPYGETSLEWDRWLTGWPALVAARSAVPQMWCFGSTRMFLDRREEFADWRQAQDLVWSKPRGRGMTSDRFNRSHELVLHWYRGKWGDLYLDTPRVVAWNDRRPDRGLTRKGEVGDGSKVRPMAGTGTYQDDGKRLMQTVIDADPGAPVNLLHPTQKPLAVLEPIIQYSCPHGGLVADLFAGSSSTLVAAKRLGRRAIGIEANEQYCEIAARRLAQGVLDFGSAS